MDSSSSDGPACYSFVAVYDGHCGDEAAEYLREHLHINVAKHMPWPLPTNYPFATVNNTSPTHKSTPAFSLNNWDPHESVLSFSTQVQEAMKLGAHETEVALLEESQKNNWIAGCVSAIAIVSGRQLYIGHAGDCRAVMCRDGKAIPLTQDHRPSLLDENERIISAGGNVLHGCLGGFLAVSRAFGDYDPKTNSKIPGLTAMLHVDKYFLTDDDEFMVIASDGLWDAMTNAEVSGFTRTILSRDPDQDVQYAAQKLVAEAVRRNSDDNVTAIVIGFGKIPERTENDQAPDPIIIQRRKSVLPIQRRNSVLQSSPLRASNIPHPLSSPNFRLNSPRTQGSRLAGLPPLASFSLRDNDHQHPLHTHSHPHSTTSTTVESIGTPSASTPASSTTINSTARPQRPRLNTGFLLSLLQNAS
jgi:serine/threonine protein phosphatase PrpC